jgi:serine/threonine-protein kinase
MPLHSGEQFAGYTIERLLGAGGMGEVYLAQHPRLPRHDALKILTARSTGDDEFRARFIREADLAATLWHPHIVGVLDRGEFNGRLWISMDYVDGTDAGRLIRERYPRGMPERDVCEIVTAVADALDFGHERHLLHRDVKPENILVTDGQRRRVLLTDFGIARRMDEVSNLTDDNMAIGTISYVAPEQLLGRSLDGRADQYALAATAFHLLTGAPPFNDANRAVVISHHLGTPPPRISERRPDLAHLDAVLRRALAKDPAHRYPTCLDFANALSRVDQIGSATTPSSRSDRSMPDHTERLERLTVRGIARGVRHPDAAAGQVGIVYLQVVPHEPVGNQRGPIAVQMPTQLAAAQLSDGDEVDVTGVFDGVTLDAETIVNLSAGARRRQHRRHAAGVRAPKSRKMVIGALAGVIAVAVAAIVYVSDGFGLWSRPGPTVTVQSATVFSPAGAPDNPQDARLVIDGNPNTSWTSVTYKDPVPFPDFVEGEGLLLHLAEPTALSAVSVDLASTGTEVQIRSSATDHPTSLADTTELTPTMPLQPGHNRIEVHDDTETSNVLVWIAKLGSIDGQSRTTISDITLQAAR